MYYKLTYSRFVQISVWGLAELIKNIAYSNLQIKSYETCFNRNSSICFSGMAGMRMAWGCIMSLDVSLLGWCSLAASDPRDLCNSRRVCRALSLIIGKAWPPLCRTWMSQGCDLLSIVFVSHLAEAALLTFFYWCNKKQCYRNIEAEVEIKKLASLSPSPHFLKQQCN